MDRNDEALDHGHVVVPCDRHHAGGALGLCGARLGRLLGLGPGGKRLPDAVAYRYRFSALRDDAGKARHDEGLEHGPDLLDLLSLHLRNLPDAQRRGLLSARLRAIGHRSVFRWIPGSWNSGFRLAPARTARLSEEQSADRFGGLARVEFPVQ